MSCLIIKHLQILGVLHYISSNYEINFHIHCYSQRK